MAKITPEGAKAFHKRYWPSEDYDEFEKKVDADPDTFFLDTEDLFTQSEKMEDYQTLIRVIRKQRIDHPMERGWLATFLIVHQMRSHAIMESHIEWGLEHGEAEFEFFLTLKWLWSDAEFMFELVRPIAYGTWTFYVTAEESFPLCDNPVLLSGDTLMIALSPCMLLEIDRARFSPDDRWTLQSGVSEEKLEQFRRMTIANTFREIIFGRRDLLERWQRTSEYQKRREIVNSARSFNELVGRDGAGELWKLNAHGNTLGES